MGGSSSKLTEEQLSEVRRLIEKWANDQDSQTNSAMRAQYTRVTDLMNQLSRRLTDRQDASQERVERQVKELQEQLESMQKRMKSKDEARPSGNRINDILNELQSLMAPALSEKGGSSFDGFPNKTPNQPPMNYMMRQQGFGLATMHHGTGGPQFGHQGFQGPYGPNPNMPHPSAHPFPQNYHPTPFPPSQQPFAPMFPHPNNPYNFSRNPMQQAPSDSRANTAKKETPKPKMIFKSKSEAPAKKSDNRKANLSMPEVKNVTRESTKSNDPNIVNITKCFTESRKKISNNEDINLTLEDIQDMVAKFKQQQLENATEKPPTNAKFDKNKNQNANAKRKDPNHRYAKFNQGNDEPEKRDQPNKTETGDRRGQFKARGRGRGSHQQWIHKNRQARQKHHSRNLNDQNNESDSDSNESVASNFSCASKASIVPPGKNKKVYWTTRPEYARNYNFERTRSQIEVACEGLNLENYKNETESDGGKEENTTSSNQSLLQGGQDEKNEANKNESQKEEENTESESGRDDNRNVAKPSSSGSSNLKVINYPSEEEAVSQGRDLQKPLERPVLFIGLTESGQHHTHQPKCLAEIYKLEKIYDSRELISLT